MSELQASDYTVIVRPITDDGPRYFEATLKEFSRSFVGIGDTPGDALECLLDEAQESIADIPESELPDPQIEQDWEDYSEKNLLEKAALDVHNTPDCADAIHELYRENARLQKDVAAFAEIIEDLDARLKAGKEHPTLKHFRDLMDERDSLKAESFRLAAQRDELLDLCRDWDEHWSEHGKYKTDQTPEPFGPETMKLWRRCRSVIERVAQEAPSA